MSVEWLAYILYYADTTVIEVLVFICSATTFLYCVDAAVKSWGDRRILLANEASMIKLRQCQRELRTAIGRAFVSGSFLAIAILAARSPARIPPTTLSLVAMVLLASVVLVVGLMQFFDVRDRHDDLSEIVQDNKMREAMVAGVIVIDRYSTIHQFNTAAASIFGYPPERVLGQKMTMLIPERFRDAHLRGVAAAYLRDDPGPRIGTIIDLPGLHADGHEVPLHIILHETHGVAGKMFIAIFTMDNEGTTMDEITPEIRRHNRLTSEVRVNTAITIAAKESADRAFETANHANAKIAETNARIEQGSFRVEEALDIARLSIGTLQSLVERLERERVTRDEEEEV